MSNFDTIFQNVVYTRTYARWLPEVQRREYWPEGVDRYIGFLKEEIVLKRGLPPESLRYVLDLLEEAKQEMLVLGVVGSMRALWTAGKALTLENACAYNCAYTTIEHFKDFAEILYLLMCGCGVSYSAERQFITKLSTIPELQEDDRTIVFEDSKHGWAEGYYKFLSHLSKGYIPKYDLSKIRKKGMILKTFGGRCLTGDTLVYKDRKKSTEENSITLKQLYDIQQREKGGKYRGRFAKICLRSMNEEYGFFYRNQLVEVIDNGMREVVEITTKKGYKIKATLNHRFMDSDKKWKEVSHFIVGEKIAVNGENKTSTCVDCGVAISRRAERCKSCSDLHQQKADCSGTTARGRKACLDSRLDYCEICGKYSGKFEVHHIDGNPTNNHPSNHLNACPTCHKGIHANEDTYGNPYSHKYLSFDTIESIVKKGVEQVYDLSMQAPDHNFVANGFISHNSSGPEPLRDLLNFTVRLFKNAQGNKLTSEEVSDLVCKIADIVVVGGARRSATLALTNPSDRRMAEYKKGDYFREHSHRSMVNVSSCYTDIKRPGVLLFLEDMTHLIESKSGERGFVNRAALNNTLERLGRPMSDGTGVNPCGEIILRPKGFCNLSEIIVREGDSLDILKRKARLATVLGFLQSMLTDFKFISPKWKQNCIEDRILGLSLTGLRDHEVLGVAGYTAEGWLDSMYYEAHAIERTLAAMFGVEPAKAITCVKPSGTVSQLVNSASGLHVRYSKEYIRRIRMAVNDPLAKLLIAQGMEFSPENGETYENARTYVFSFPIKAPSSSKVKAEVSALQQLEYWKMLKVAWCDHNPSCTVYVRDHEWVAVAAWVYENFDILGGISFLPDENIYEQAPYEEITSDEYILRLSKFPAIDLTMLSDFEAEDYTTGAQEAACSGGNCELN